MNSWGWRRLGAWLVILGLILMAVGIFQHEGQSRALSAMREETCQGSVAQTADDLEARYNATARSTDPQTGDVYLRTKKGVFIISDSSGECVVRAEDLGNYNSGHYVYLGSGFRPSSPSNSSGGSAGSNSGGGTSNTK